MKKWMAVMLLLVLVLFGGVFGFHFFKQNMIAKYIANMPRPPVPVTALVAETIDWTPVIESIGFIEPVHGVTLSMQNAGLVSNILFRSGQQIEEGELLVQLDQSVEKANLATAQGRLAATRNSLQRLRDLEKSSMSSKAQREQAEAEYQALQGQIDSYKAVIARRETRAPFSGIIGIRQIHLGQYLQPGAEVARLENIDVMQLRFIIVERDYARINVGMPVSVQVDAYPDRSFNGEISAIEPAVEYSSGVIHVQSSIPNSDQLLRSGMYAEVTISLEMLRNQIVIPQGAINFTLYGETVYIIREEKQENGDTWEVVHQVIVEVAERRGSLARVTSGIKSGDRIVTSGQLKLDNGTHIEIVDSDLLKPPQTLPRN